jgi:hypothetical protein
MSDQPPRPEWYGVIPHCDERCPFFDGKRCEILGQRPSRICEPVVLQMGVRLNKRDGGDDGQA